MRLLKNSELNPFFLKKKEKEELVSKFQSKIFYIIYL